MLVLLLLFFCIFPPQILADDPAIKISNFSSNLDSEWVELLNNTDENISFNGWALRDENDNSNNKDSLLLTGCISPHSYQTFYHNKGWLNNDKDTIYLYDTNKILIDLLTYSVGKTDSNPKSDNNCVPTSTPTPTPITTLTPTLTEAPIPTSTSVPTPTIIKTPTPTKTSTPTPTKTPTSTPTPTPTPTKTPTGNSALQNTPTSISATESAILVSTETPVSTPTSIPEVLGTTTTNKKNYFPLIFICLGGLFLLTPLIIAKIKHEN